MAKYRMKVFVEDQRSTADRFQGVVERQKGVLRSIIKDYLGNQSGLLEGDRVKIKVSLEEESFEPSLGELPRYREQARLEVSGILAGKQFRFEKEHWLPIQVGTPKKATADPEPPTADDQTTHELLFEELTNLVLEGIEKSTGRTSSPIARIWFAIKLAIVGTSLLVMGTLFYFCFTTGFIGNMKALVGICMIFGFGTYLIGLTIGAALMPLRFFEEHVEGHRVMGFVNTDDPAHAQRTLRIGVVVLILIAAFMVYTYRSTFG